MRRVFTDCWDDETLTKSEQFSFRRTVQFLGRPLRAAYQSVSPSAAWRLVGLTAALWLALLALRFPNRLKDRISKVLEELQDYQP